MKFLLSSIYLALALLLSGCDKFFENAADVQARKALTDLMKIQDSYRQENGKYARNLMQIEKYNLKYHTGIVYLEIESSGPDKYRAISLPAESTTARVFAYDTDKGGFYEMDEEEVSSYVLGALNFIRKEKHQQNMVDFFSFLLVGVLLIAGARFFKPYHQKKNRVVLFSYLLSIFPLGWSVGVINHMGVDIVFSSTLAGICLVSLVICISTFMLSFRWLTGKADKHPSLVSLMACTLILSLFSGGTLILTFTTFYR